MPSEIFENLFYEKVEIFKNAFSATSKAVFYDKNTNKLIHPGEFGTFRESIAKEFIRSFIPESYKINTGFLVNTFNEVSTQCDLVIYDSDSTPLIQTSERQRFYPVETVCGIGEIKSTLSKKGFKDAINKLAKVKCITEKVQPNPGILKRFERKPFDPTVIHSDMTPTFLICEKLDFDLSKIENEIESYYEAEVKPRHRHNLILSINDGTLLYTDRDGQSHSHPVLYGTKLIDRFIFPKDADSFAHFKIFCTSLFLMTSSNTILYPEIVHYLGLLTDGGQRDKRV